MVRPCHKRTPTASGTQFHDEIQFLRLTSYHLQGAASMGKTWCITGSSCGFGRRFAEAALSRSDKVAATARDTGSLAGLAAAHGAASLPLPWTSGPSRI